MKMLSLMLSVASLCLGGCTEGIDVEQVPERGFHSDRPARVWEESLVAGNGTMGVMVEGDPYDEAIVFNHALLYLPLYEPLPPVSQGEHMDEIRRLMLAGRYEEASQFVVDLSKREGYNEKRATDPFIPAFRLHVQSDSAAVEDYARTVDFRTGEVEVKWRDERGAFSRRLFVSRPDNVVAMRLTSADGARLHTTLRLSQIMTRDEGRWKKFHMSENNCIADVANGCLDDALYFRATYERLWKVDTLASFEGYEGVVKVVRADGAVRAEDDRLVIDGATDVLLLARVEPSRDMSASGVEAMAEALSAYGDDYATLLAPHAAVQSEWFDRVSLDLGASEVDRAKSSEELLALGGEHPALVERLFDAARYNVISATGVNPPNLQGIWGATMTAPWSGDYTTNGNLPVVISHYLQAHTPELMLPLFNRLESFMDAFRDNAQRMYNCRGIHVPSRFSTHGWNNHFDATWPMTFWTMGAAWYSLFYYDYYLYTLDEQFLRDRALPFMTEAALFYEDFLQEGADGKYMFNPSYSPENHPLNSRSQACINATMEVMAANALLRSVIEGSRIAGVNEDKIPVWEAMLQKMPAYQLNEAGEIREWMWKDLQDNHDHRHASHLFGLYDYHDPLLMSDSALIEGCKRAIDRRMEIRRESKGGVMAFGMIQLAFSACALGERETTADILGWLGNTYWNNNLVSTHDPGRTFNLDICGGYPSLVMKMLAYAEPGMVSLLPCKPEAWTRGSIKGMALRGGILMKELTWDGDRVKAVFVTQKDQSVNLLLQGKAVKTVDLKAGSETVVEI